MVPLNLYAFPDVHLYKLRYVYFLAVVKSNMQSGKAGQYWLAISCLSRLESSLFTWGELYPW
jgi:hypothetical protein